MPRTPPTELKCDKATNRAFIRWQGRKVYFGRAGSQEASKAFGKWLADLQPEPTNPPPRSRLTVIQCVEQYLYHAESYYSKDGVRSHEFRAVSLAMGILLEHSGGQRDFADEFGPRKLAKIQEAMAKQAVSKEDQSLKYCRNTINTRIHQIRRCFRWCATQEFIPASVVNALDLVPGIPSKRGVARETEAVRPVEIRSVLATLPYLSPTVSAMVRVQLLCGMRPQDVCRMTGRELEMKDDIWMYRPAEHKNAHKGQSLVKAIPPAAQEIIKPFLRSGPSEILFSPVDTCEYFDSIRRIGPSRRKPRKRSYYGTSDYGRSIASAIARAKKAGVTIPHWSPNQLRHAIATYLREEGTTEDAQLFLGHAKPNTTLIYAERSEKRLKQIARKLVSPLGK